MSLHRVYIDAETFSECDLPARGLANYWDHPSTGMHCMAVKVDNGPIRLWKANYESREDRDLFGELQDHIRTGSLIVAHKAEFEFYLLQRLGFSVKLGQMRCTMAKAAAMALPMSLGKLSLALGFQVAKHTAGQKAMRILCKPNPATGKMWLYHEAPQLFEDLYTYCIQDVQLEYDIDQILPDLSDEEQEMWVLDQQINRRGIGVDRRAAAAAYEICTAEIGRLDAEIRSASNGAVDSTKAVLQIARFCGMDSVAKANIEEALDDSLVPDPLLTDAGKRVLRIRQEAAKSSVLKLKPMLELCSADGRVRWTQQFNGAGTGRWGGRNPQPHNFPRGQLHLTAEEQNVMLTWLANNADNLERARQFSVSPALATVSDLLRGMFIAAPGYEFSSYDFAQIEMVLGAWFVGDEGLLEVFRGDRKVYEYTYATSFGVSIESVTKDQRQAGKVLALGAQFGGGTGALMTGAKQIKMVFDPDPVKAEEVAEDLKVRWREAHPRFPKYWKDLEKAAKEAVMNPGRHCTDGGRLEMVSYHLPLAADGTPGCVLQCTLPSGRVISYPYPRIERRTVTKKDGDTWETDSLTYMVTDNGRWMRTATYGGKLFENIVQAAAADLLRFAIRNLNNVGIATVLMVHDEVITETATGTVPWSRGAEVMERRPDWCMDLPIKVTGWVGRRYKKD
jgi:DNA polymerase